jgi:hypothetical protein
VLTVTMGDGSTRRVWCTFGPQQIDINPFSAPGGGLSYFKSGLWLPKVVWSNLAEHPMQVDCC